MKRYKLLLTIYLVLIHFTISAQLQWFQNQDGNNPYPNGTVATSVQSFTRNSFIGVYLWHIESDQFTWKISKTRTDGTEQKTFFITGTTAQVEARVGRRNTNYIYVLKKDFPFGFDPQYTLYRLDSNLNVIAEKQISFPGGYAVFNMNAFKLDEYDNAYLAGDGQYPDGPGFMPASFVMKTDRALNIAWTKMDSAQTAYTDVHIDGSGYVWVIEDYYANFPNVTISKRAPNGQLKWKKAIETEAGRFSLSSAVTEEDNLIIYGGKAINDNVQAIYLWKIGKNYGNVVYKKTYLPANGISLADVKLDRAGNIFTLVTQYFNPGKIVSRVSRINSWNGNLCWTRSFSYTEDSCNLLKLVVNDNDKFYVLGEKKKDNIYSRGFSARIKKNGQLDEKYISPDSVAFSRSHWLIDGIVDRDNQLISIGLTQDLNPETFESTYLRSFAIKFGQKKKGHHDNDCDWYGASAAVVAEDESMTMQEVRVSGTSPTAFPNPAHSELTVTNLSEGQYNSIVVYNLQGRQVLQQSVNGNTARFDVSKLPGGVYMVQLQSAAKQKQQTLRIVVAK